MAEIKQQEFSEGKKTTYVGGLEFTLSRSIQNQMINYANKCMDAYGQITPEPTKIQKLHNVPSNLIRVDFSVQDPEFIRNLQGKYELSGEQINPYETEENPRGRFVVGSINPTFKDLFYKFHKPGIDNIAIVSELRKLRNNFDDIKLPNYVVDIEDAKSRLKENPALFINPIDTKEDRLGLTFPDLQSHFGTTSTTEGNKQYQIELGYARRCGDEFKQTASKQTDEAIFFQTSKDTSKAYGISFYHPAPRFVHPVIHEDSKYIISKESAIKRLRDENLIAKPYYPPINIDQISKYENLPELQNYVGIIRFYLAFCHIPNQYIPIGGIFMARPHRSVIIHGTEDSVSIPINPY